VTRRVFILAALAAGLASAGVAWAKERVHVGELLHSDTGQWTENPTRYTYRWQRRPTNGSYTTVQDGNADTYLIEPADVGSVIRVQVTAYNNGQSQPASSPATSMVRR